MDDLHVPNLDDISKTSYHIPFNPSNTDLPKALIPKSYNPSEDVENGRGLRFIAYKDAWSKCLGRMQQIVRDLQAATVNDVVQEIRGSYMNILPGLPYAELPIVTLTDSGLGSAVLHDIASELESGRPSHVNDGSKCFVAHLYPGDVPNVLTGMRSIISNLIAKEEIDTVKRKLATSLTPYDVKYLVAWYRAWLDRHDVPPKPNIVVVLHEFEQFDPVVMQDIFDICSNYVPELPIVFLLSMTSPLPNYLNLTYARATLTLLRVRQFSSPEGIDILETLIFKTFFEADFKTDVMIGPALLKYLQDYFTRYNPSVDAIFSILQLAHLKHFSSDSITVFVGDTNSVVNQSNREVSPLVEALTLRISRISKEGLESGDQHVAIIRYVDEARVTFTHGLNNIKFGVNILLLIQAFLQEQGYIGLKLSPDLGQRSKLWDAIICVLDDQLARIIKDLAIITRKLKRHEILAILDRVYKYLHNLPFNLSSSKEEQTAKSDTVHIRSLVQKGDDDDSVAHGANVFSKWITGYLSAKLKPLENCPLWDIWYMGQSPFPSEIINPSIRASIIAGLLQPHAFASGFDPNSPDDLTKSLRDLPDTSILFKRYLDSSKMINVYDWFESFKTVLDDQRQHYKNLATAHIVTSPRKRGRGKGKGKAEAEPEGATIEEDDAKWGAHVQARFIRAVHELDYLGFIKHSGRKADHLVRMLFEVDDAQ